MKGLYTENYKIVLKEIKDKWKISHIYGLENLILVRLVILPKAVYRFKEFFYQNPNDVLFRNRKTLPKIYMESQGTLNSPSHLEKASILRNIGL